MLGVLFVDDDRRVLDGLRRMLRGMRHEWRMEFVDSAQAALERLKAEPFDVILTDMRMPGMDGAALLECVMRDHPGVVRIVLSGHSEREAILRSVGPAHQFLAKPCDPEVIRHVILRASRLRALLTTPELRAVVGQVRSLPVLPDVYVELRDALRSPDCSTHQVGQIIARDMGATAKILQLVNSAFFGLRREVTDATQAAALLGIDTLQALVFVIGIFSQLDTDRCAGLNPKSLIGHCYSTGTLARQICMHQHCPSSTIDQSLLAGMLHDLGKLVLACSFTDDYQRVLSAAPAGTTMACAQEREVFGVTHAEVGAYLLGMWGLPDPVVEAVAYHHRPGDCEGNEFLPLTAVHTANALHHVRASGRTDDTIDLLDEEYLARIGVRDRIDAWRGLVVPPVGVGV